MVENQSIFLKQAWLRQPKSHTMCDLPLKFNFNMIL